MKLFHELITHRGGNTGEPFGESIANQPAASRPRMRRPGSALADELVEFLQ